MCTGGALSLRLVAAGVPGGRLSEALWANRSTGPIRHCSFGKFRTGQGRTANSPSDSLYYAQLMIRGLCTMFREKGGGLQL